MLSASMRMATNMHFAQMPDRACLQGLNPDATYRVTGCGTFTGRGLMPVGLPIVIRGDASSEILLLEKI